MAASCKLNMRFVPVGVDRQWLQAFMQTHGQITNKMWSRLGNDQVQIQITELLVGEDKTNLVY